MVSEAQDNLISAKVSQAFHANKSHTLAFPFKIGERVVLSTAHDIMNLKPETQTTWLSSCPVLMDHLSLRILMRNIPQLP